MSSPTELKQLEKEVEEYGILVSFIDYKWHEYKANEVTGKSKLIYFVGYRGTMRIPVGEYGLVKHVTSAIAETKAGVLKKLIERAKEVTHESQERTRRRQAGLRSGESNL